MKKVIFVILLAAMAPFLSHAQFKNILNKAKSKIDQRVDSKIDKGMDNTLDKAEGKTAQQPVNEPEETTTPVATAAKAEPAGFKSYSKFDFIPGEQVVYYENFEQDAIGELPMEWNTNGTAEVVTLGSAPGKWMRLHKQFAYLTANKKEFGDNYTVELDLILQLKNNGWMYPVFNVGLLATKDAATTANGFLQEYKDNAAVEVSIYPAENKTSRTRLDSWLEKASYFKSETKQIGFLDQYWGKPVHIAIQVQKERFRIWINEEKAFDAPKGVPAGYIMNQLRFEVEATNYNEEQYSVYISNVKVAKGIPDTRHKLMEEGKFSTTGILFDFQSAVIKPESFGVIKEIAGVIKDNAGIRVKVIGHTSSDGDDNANLELSKKRSAAVKDLLVSEFGIDAARIDTEGKGETQPVADNKTKEGKALNRRVEFIKL
jgi:outer membrane protein OmpA-like peptidoglycan-associated protein